MRNYSAQEKLILKFGLSEFEINAICNIFNKYSAIEKVILYGSRAKGNYTDRSDIDLVTIGHIDRHLIASILMEFDELDIMHRIDLQQYENIRNNALKEHIDRVGVVFYESMSKAATKVESIEK